jgi:hypothetical protein
MGRLAAERPRGMEDGLMAAAALVRTKIIATSRISRTARPGYQSLEPVRPWISSVVASDRSRAHEIIE